MTLPHVLGPRQVQRKKKQARTWKVRLTAFSVFVPPHPTVFLFHDVVVSQASEL